MPQHHYIPQTYLKGFATDDDDRRVFFYDKRVGEAKKRLIEDVCSQNNLYRLLMDGGEPSDDLEQSFANIAEPAFKEIVTKLLNREPLTHKQKSEFAAYICLQMIRTPASRKIHDAMETAIMDIVANKQWAKLLDDDERAKAFEDIRKETGVDVSALTKEDIQGIIDGTKFKTEWDIPKENWIKRQFEMLLPILRAYERMHWRVVFAPKGSAFITSDNPLGVLVRMRDGWYLGTAVLAPGSIRVFPLSKNACLTMLDTLPSGYSFVDGDKRRVQQLNNVTAASYHNILISHSKPLLERNVKRVGNFSLIDDVIEHQTKEIKAMRL